MARLPPRAAISRALEETLFLVVAGSVLALGAVHPWAYVPLWLAAVGLAALVVLRGRGTTTADRWPQGSLLRPGLAFLAWAALALVPLPSALVRALGATTTRPWSPLAASPTDTARGLAFVASMILIHAAATAALESEESRRRLRLRLVGLGFFLALVAMIQFASGTRRVYGVFRPQEGDGSKLFGPFVNRNHFAGYMLLIVPLAFGLTADAYRRLRSRLRGKPTWRAALVALDSPEGLSLAVATLAVAMTVLALVASGSRGGNLALVAGLGVGAIGSRRRALAVVAAAAVAVLTVAVLAPAPVERMTGRFLQARQDVVSRTAVWRDSIHRMNRWWVGCGLNGFGACMSRSVPWKLPRGATPWPAAVWRGEAEGSPVAFRVPADSPEMTWYAQAHNDYLQVLVETGVPGLALALAAAAAALRGARRDPTLLAALAAVLVHELVDFDLQIPAVAVLFVTLCGMARPARTAEARRHEDPRGGAPREAEGTVRGTA